MTDDRRDETGEDVLNRILAVDPLPLDEELGKNTDPSSTRVSDEGSDKEDKTDEASEEEPTEDKKLPFFRKNNPALWVGALIVVIFAGVLTALLLWPQPDPYPDTVTFDDERTFTLDLAPADQAQTAAVQYLLEYARDRTTLSAPCYLTFEVTGMDTFPFDPSWADYTSNTIYSSSLNLTATTGDDVSYDTVVLAAAQVTCSEQLLNSRYVNYWDGYHMFYVFLAQEEDGTYTVDHIYLEPDGSETPLLTNEWEAGGKSYTLSVYGTGGTLTYIGTADGVTEEGDLNGSEDEDIWVSSNRYVSRAILSDGESSQLLFLAESSNVYFSGWNTDDINGDGEPDLTLTPWANQLIYLYDQESGGYVRNETLSGAYLELNTLFTGSLLYYAHLGETDNEVSYLSYYSSPRSLTELARMETTYLSGETKYSFYIDGELVREMELGYGDGTEYGVSAVWKETMLRAVLDHCLATLPTQETNGSEAGVVWLGQEDDVTFYSASGSLLMVADEDGWTVLPVYSGYTMPFYGDFDGDGEKEIVCGCWGHDPSVIRKTEQGWDVTTLCSVNELSSDVNSNLEHRWEERADDYLLHVTYGGLEATIPLSETGMVSYFMDSYYSQLSMGADGTIQFPITAYLYVPDTGGEDMMITATIYFTVDLDGETEAVDIQLTR